MEGVVWGRFVITSPHPYGCGASISDLVTCMDSCTSEETDQLGDICLESSYRRKECKTVPDALVASPIGNSVSRPWPTWAASDPGGMSNFGRLFLF